ncbi:MAG: hypothetical protein RSB93_03750, partial [Rikenellaceae bacterium]
MFGARPVKRAIQQYLINELSKKILAGNIERERPIVVESDGHDLIFKN